jgi:hypothetical protein
MENFDLHNEDRTFINSLLKTNNSFNKTNDDYNIVNSVITLFKLKKNNTLDCNITLLNIFDKLSNDLLIHTNLKKIIAEKILTKMILATSISPGLNKIPKDLFKNKNFFSYILNTNLFNKKMIGKTPFEAVLSNQKNIDYFNLNEIITNTPNLEKFLLIESKFFYKKLINLSRTIVYSKLMLRDIKKFIFFIKIVNNYVSKQHENTEESIKLINANIKTYFILLENISNIYLSSKESIELFELFSAKNLQDHNLLISRCTNDMNHCLIFLNDFFLDSKFNNYMLLLVNSVNLNKKSAKENQYESLILSILSIFTFKNIKYSTKTIYNISKIRDNIVNYFKFFLKNDHFNIHQKVKFLLDISIPEFVKYFITKDNEFILENEFMNLYIDIEKYNESNGFYDKLRLRGVIINILNDSFQITKQFNFLNNKTFKTFFTLLLSEFNSYTSKIEKFKSKIIELLKNDKYSLRLYPNMCSFIINLKQMISCYKIITKIIHVDFILTDNFFISKLVQLNHSILHSHYYTRLYTELPLYNLSNLSLNIVSSIFSEKINRYINLVYSDFVYLFNNDLFVKYIINNEEIYPMEILDKTKKIFGEYFIEVSSQKKIKVDKIIDDFKDKINNDKKIYKNDVYKTEIPENYLDPILLIPIKDPLELPNTKNIIDRETIINHLVFNKTNPFNGLPLCEEELLEYNKKTDVIERVNNFKYNFNNWKLDNKI